jgi:hypothetical protein
MFAFTSSQYFFPSCLSCSDAGVVQIFSSTSVLTFLVSPLETSTLISKLT